MTTTDQSIPTTSVPSAGRPARSRALALLVALTIVLCGVATAAGPASANVSTAPRAIAARGYATQIRVYWAPPVNDGGEAVTSYRVERYVVGNPALNAFWNRTDSRVLLDTTALNAVAYRYRVRATNDDGDSAWSGWMNAARVAGFDDYNQFGGNKVAFVIRQFHDFLGRDPSAAELNAFVLHLNNATLTPQNAISQLAAAPARTEARHPVIRLYAAYFDRAPDHSGLAYWAGQRASGAKTLDDVSSSFAGSNEFATKYGALSNADFVTLVYQNVLHRDPEPTGFAFWTSQLDGGQVTRGRVMTQFSESNEFTQSSTGFVWAADIYDAMLHTTISSTNLALWASHIRGGGAIGFYATRLMLYAAY